MNEALQKLLESELLNDETRAELKEAIEAYQASIKEAVEKDVTAEVTARLTEQFIADKEALVEAIDTKLETLLKEEIEELKADIENFRDLEAEYAGKLVEARAEMAEQLKSDLGELVENLDAFLEVRLAEEIEELRESIEEVKKVEFGRQIYETFASAFHENFADEDGIRESLAEAKREAKELKDQLDSVLKESQNLARTSKMREVLEPLVGKPREVMEAILKNVPTNKLEEAYDTYISRVLHESVTKVEDNKEKESVLAEGTSTTGTEETVIVTGDVEPVTEGHQPPAKVNDAVKARLQRLAGITSN